MAALPVDGEATDGLLMVVGMVEAVDDGPLSVAMVTGSRFCRTDTDTSLMSFSSMPRPSSCLARFSACDRNWIGAESASTKSDEHTSYTHVAKIVDTPSQFVLFELFLVASIQSQQDFKINETDMFCNAHTETC